MAITDAATGPRDVGLSPSDGRTDATGDSSTPSDGNTSDAMGLADSPSSSAAACDSDFACPASGLACQVNVCVAGACLKTPATDGTPCDDSDPCTVDACVAGQCLGIPEPSLCPPADPCAIDNGGCGDPAWVSCVWDGSSATCQDIDACLTDNGGCGGKAWYVCSDVVAGPPECALVEGFHMPWACKKTYSCTAGNNATGHHTGLSLYAHDFAMPLGAVITAPRAGTVTAVKMLSKPGDPCHDGCPYKFGSQAFTDCCANCLTKANWLNLRYDDGTVGHFAHIQSATVKVGDVIGPGEPIATVGKNGCSTGPHLHTMRMKKGSDTKVGQSVPISYIEAGNPKAGQSIKSQNCP